MQTLKKLTEEYKTAFLLALDEYEAAYKIMDSYEGKVIKDIGLDKVNNTLHEVQNTFSNLWPALNFIYTYAKFSEAQLLTYAEWRDKLAKDCGSTFVEKSNATSITIEETND